MTEWRAIPGYEGAYEVSDDGQIRSLDRYTRSRWGTPRFLRGKMLRPTARPDGKLIVRLASPAHPRGRNRLLHQLLMLAFVGPYPPGMEICHNDGVGGNCRLTNLRYDTPVNNQKDKVRHGTQPRGDALAKKLTEKAVREILSAASETGASLAKQYGVSAATVYSIRNRRIWAHVVVNQ